MATLDIVGLKEIAERLGVKQQTAATWRWRNLLPPEEGTVSGAPAWSWTTIERWARETGRLGGVAEFVADETPAVRVVDDQPVLVRAGVVVWKVSSPFPQPLPDGRLERRVRFLAAVDGQWYELPHDAYLRATGAVSDGSTVGKVVLAAGTALGLIILVDQVSRQQQEPGPKT
jgi:hypothetical protein